MHLGLCNPRRIQIAPEFLLYYNGIVKTLIPDIVRYNIVSYRVMWSPIFFWVLNLYVFRVYTLSFYY